METQPLFLCIETSSPICSVALGRGAVCVDESISNEPNGHSRLLTVMVDEIMRKNDVSFQDLDAVVVSSGPGSYTGLRIGMSTAKGLCYAAEKPLISISTFESMVRAFIKSNTVANEDLLVPMVDARRMEVYTQVFDSSGNATAEQMSYISGNEGLFHETPKGKVWIFGSGAEKMAEGLSSHDIQADGNPFISAANLLPVAQKRWNEKQFDDIAYTTPNYGKAWQKA